MKIPRISVQPILEPQPVDTGVSQAISKGFQALQTGLNVAAEFKSIKDTVKSNEAITRFQLEADDKWNKFKQDREKNPENSAEDFDTILSEMKDDFLDSADVSTRARARLSGSIDSIRTRFGINARDEERSLMITNFAESSETSSEINEELAYRSGRNIDFETMSNIEGNIEANLKAGSRIVASTEISKMRKTQVSRTWGNFVKGIASVDPIRAIKMLESNKTLKSKLDVEERDLLKKYALNVKRTQDFLEKDPTYSDKSVSKAAMIQQNTIRIETEFQKFGITKKDGKVVVENKTFNSIEDLMTLRDDLRITFAQGNLKPDDYSKKIVSTNLAMANMLAKPRLLNSVNNQIIRDLKKIDKKGVVLTRGEFVGIYEDTIKDLISEEINPKSLFAKKRKRAKELLIKNVELYQQLRTTRNDARNVLIRGNIVPLNNEAKSEAGTKLDNGWDPVLEEDTKTGKLYRVKRDSQGKVKKWEEVK